MILIFDFEFSAAHFYKNAHWSSEKNRTVFGKCYTPYGHGHNYKLQLEIDIGAIAAPLAKTVINTLVAPLIHQIDHRHLNFDIAHFQNLVPTTENISLYLRDQIALPAAYQLKRLRLFEMDSIFVELTL